VLTVLVVELALGWVLPLNPESYLCAYRSKHQRLRELDPGKLIICGGSNVAFGVDTEQLGAALGRDGVNMGVHMGLGLAFMVQEVIPQVEYGDVVLFCPEYQQLNTRTWRGNKNLGQLLFDVPEAWPNVVPANFPSVVFSFPSCVQGRFLSVVSAVMLCGGNISRLWDSDSIYRRASFNRWGDMAAHWGQGPTSDLSVSSMPPIGAAVARGPVRCLRELAKVCEKRGARMVLLPPCLMAEAYKENRECLVGLWEALRAELGDIVVGSPQDYVFERKLHYDTVYHLNRQGVEKRTILLGRDLLRLQLGKPGGISAETPGQGVE
jgi:hypothetical protein